MRFYKWTIILSENHNKVLRRNLELRDENTSVRNENALLRQQNESLEAKCSLVNIAKLQNRIAELEELLP